MPHPLSGTPPSLWCLHPPPPRRPLLSDRVTTPSSLSPLPSSPFHFAALTNCLATIFKIFFLCCCSSCCCCSCVIVVVVWPLRIRASIIRSSLGWLLLTISEIKRRLQPTDSQRKATDARTHTHIRTHTHAHTRRINLFSPFSYCCCCYCCLYKIRVMSTALKMRPQNKKGNKKPTSRGCAEVPDRRADTQQRENV